MTGRSAFVATVFALALPSSAPAQPTMQGPPTSSSVVQLRWLNATNSDGQAEVLAVALDGPPEALVRRAREVARAEEAFRRGKLSNDVAALRTLFDDAVTETNQNGNIRDKQGLLQLWESFPIRSLTITGANVRFSGNTAVVSGEQTEGNAGTDVMLFTRVYIDSGEGWRLLSSTQFRNPRAIPSSER